MHMQQFYKTLSVCYPNLRMKQEEKTSVKLLLFALFFIPYTLRRGWLAGGAAQPTHICLSPDKRTNEK